MAATYAAPGTETANSMLLSVSKRAARAMNGWSRGVPRTANLCDVYALMSYARTQA